MNEKPVEFRSGRDASLPARLLRSCGSIWVGVTLLIIIFLYSSIGSALPPVRQGALADWLGLEFLRFEKTEMQWFSWWPFQAMIVLLCTSMVLATIRIKLRLINAGVWAIHTGIIMLAISSAIYFGSKVEGEAVIFHSKALVMTPGMSEPASFVIRPEAKMTVGQPGSRYSIQVADLDPDYAIRDGSAKGKKTTAIWLSVSSMDTGYRFARRLLLGYPEMTEDYLIESGGAVPISQRLQGRKLADERLQIQLWYDPAEHFYLNDTSAVYARFSPDEDWTELRAADMPHYYEHVDEPGTAWVDAGQRAPKVHPLDIQAQPVGQNAKLEDIQIRVTGYLPYADERAEWIPGGDQLNPLLKFTIKAPFATTSDQLLARVSGKNRMQLPTGQSIEFKWVDAGEVASLLQKPVPRLRVQVGGGGSYRELPLADLDGKEAVPVEGTDYTVKLVRKLAAGAAGANAPAGLFVQVKKGAAQFNRVVFEGRGDGGVDLDDQMNLTTQPADAGISFQYLDPAGNRLLVIATHDGGEFDVVRTSADGQFEHRRIKLGEAVAVSPGLEFTADQIIRNARQETKPHVVPRHQRQPASLTRQTFSQARVEVRQGDWSEKVWLRFHDFAFPNVQRAQPRRFMYSPTVVQLPDGRRMELLYSRWREKLPAPVALDRFVLKTYPGGDQPSDYVSRIRFFEQGDWSGVTEVRSNHPVQHGHLWYFQSQYDPQTQSHTVLGVGNRVAVGWMLAGVCLSIAGMLYAFYIKPVLIRRRQQRGGAAARRDASQIGGPAKPSQTPHSDVVLQ